MIVFISDMIGSGLVIYDSSKNSSCRVESDFMRATNSINFTIANETISFIAGIYDMTTIHDDLFYNPLTEKKIYKMKIANLLKCPDRETANNQTELAGELSVQTGPIASAKCSIFTTNYLQSTIEGTNACKQFYPESMVVLAQNNETLQSVSGMKALKNHKELIVLSNRFDAFIFGINPNETNFFVVKFDLKKIQKEINSNTCTKYDLHNV
ncbi:PREDICTED: uncharacterized protein LOC108774532 [Cyphomyrmex costatus]|uniref:uncharacterized protein LOC108774532 n=1 Tax=Cyphomyrmex costatus TaxID=456900 RepID=UPI00085235D8|nr:PREDICTED: uncharacterized protein LOC108774532 [Cyphomyrmex costatus]